MSTERVRSAFAALREVARPYYDSLYASRAGLLPTGYRNPAAAGSIYGMTPERLQRELEQVAEWRPFQHPAVAPGCEAFSTDLPGALGIVDVRLLPPTASLTLMDPKGTGTVEACVSGLRGVLVPFTVAILGQEEGREVVFTFHPGDPIRPSSVPSEGRSGRVVSPAECLELGLLMAKVVE